jgi:hypothetical protein
MCQEGGPPALHGVQGLFHKKQHAAFLTANLLPNCVIRYYYKHDGMYNVKDSWHANLSALDCNPRYPGSLAKVLRVVK